MAKEIRILQVFGEPFATGGQESFIMNIYRNIDKEKIQFDFFTPFTCKNLEMKKEIEELGGNVYEGHGYFDVTGNKKDFVNNLKKFLKDNHYDTIHIHSGSIFALAEGSKIAKQAGAKKIIVHSHSAGFKTLKHCISQKIFTPYFYAYPTDLWACSKIAAYWKFPKKLVDNGKCKIIKNTVNVKKFKFDLNIRTNIRKKYNIPEDAIVIGTVGRISAEKNQTFLLDVFKKINEENKKTYLVIIGDGPLKSNLEEKIKNDNIDNVLLLGNQSKINEFLNIFDIFMLTSIYEGLPVTAIEAQSNSLPCIFSDNITQECKINKNVLFLSLNDSIDDWANATMNLYNKKSERNIQSEEILEYDTNRYVKTIEKEYLRKE